MADADGYRWIRHPVTRLPIREHRWVVEESNGMPLAPNKVVHHKNGDKLDNSLANLEVLTRSNHMAHHRRQFYICTLCSRPHHAVGLCKTHYTAKVRKDRGRVW